MNFSIASACDTLNMARIRGRDRRKMWERKGERKRDDKGEESD